MPTPISPLAHVLALAAGRRVGKPGSAPPKKPHLLAAAAGDIAPQCRRKRPAGTIPTPPYAHLVSVDSMGTVAAPTADPAALAAQIIAAGRKARGEPPE